MYRTGWDLLYVGWHWFSRIDYSVTAPNPTSVCNCQIHFDACLYFFDDAIDIHSCPHHKCQRICNHVALIYLKYELPMHHSTVELSGWMKLLSFTESNSLLLGIILLMRYYHITHNNLKRSQCPWVLPSYWWLLLSEKFDFHQYHYLYFVNSDFDSL